MKLTAKEWATFKTESLDYLAQHINKGDTLYFQTNYVGNVGTCDVRVFKVQGDEIHNLTWYVGNAIGYKPRDNKQGERVIRTTGYGYSRTQHVADSLSYALFGEPGLLKDRQL